MTDPTPGSRTVLVERAAITSWADDHDAVPVRSETESGAPVGFRFADHSDERLDWSAFFTAFENGQLALMVDGTDFAFVDRNRVLDAGDQQDDLAAERRAERRRADEHRRDEVVDPQSSHRADEAADQENIDNYRDEEPLES